MNVAQQIHRALGIAVADAEPPQRNAHYTKAGPGRRANTKPATKTLMQKNAGSYGRGLRNWINRKQAVEQAIRLSRRMAGAV